ncbi:MAG: TetR/AcrR family transcriptional regulator C-terminal domain-containing protein, partial [Lachnospiraceae bacterium]|nr:TetR/AcrR family transcriptional regulator C-terminal domain-containing protein [Lachnospiraceae bacterium]
MKQVPYHLAEALEEICKQKTLENITVSEIASKAGVTRQVFYHHFVDKFDLASWIHYVHLYRSVRKALEEDPNQMWRLATRYWMEQMQKNKEFYTNAFQSVSQKEFQRIIREFFFEAYRWQLEHRTKRPIAEEEEFALRLFLFGGMEKIYEWVAKGMNVSIERMITLLELSMPERISKWILSGEDVPYADALNKMMEHLEQSGLLAKENGF